jgi:chemotaxis protein histidine kinase CheA
VNDSEVIRESLIKSTENLGRLDQEIVQLEQSPKDSQLLASVFRTMHTIFGQLFRGRMLDTVTLREVHPLAEVSPAAKALMSKPAMQMDLELSIDGYGDGKLSLYS